MLKVVGHGCHPFECSTCDVTQHVVCRGMHVDTEFQFHTECQTAKLESLIIAEPFSFAPGVDSITCVLPSEIN